MRKFWLTAAGLLLLAQTVLKAQELYVFSEPASNMAAKSIGIRITQEGAFNRQQNRTIPELMVALDKNLMVHGQAFLSDMDRQYRLEGGSIYAKYRFLSIDEAQQHFRAAAFGRVSTSKRKVYTEDINLEGDNSGVQAGLIFTQLLHKLALSATLSYTKAFGLDDLTAGPNLPVANQMLGYSLSSGYLVLPFVYKNYNQPNFNLYFEMLGKTNPETGHSYLDLAPALQVVLNSRTRIDLGYRFEVAGGMANRYTKNMFLVRAEFNFFNVL